MLNQNRKNMTLLLVFVAFFLSTISSSYANQNQSIWPEIRSDFRIDFNPNRYEIRQQIKWFKYNRHYLIETLKKAGPIIYYIAKEAHKEDLPGELALIPFIESKYNPTASSSAGAAGLWQFMPQTAKTYGLNINGWYDDRLDIQKSTHSALQYYDYLNDFFNGDWLLSIAAYDSGEGTVLNAIRKNERLNQDTYFWNLKLPRETTSYIPKLLALVSIIKNPDYYDIHLPPITVKPYFDEINISSHIPLSIIASLSACNLKRLNELNPGFKHTNTGPRRHNYLLLPAGNAKEFKRILHLNPHIVLDTWKHHVIKHGETLSGIAHYYHTSVEVLQKINHVNHSRIVEHHKLLVPLTPEMLAASLKNMKYKIRLGDTLTSIAYRFHTSVKNIKSINKLRKNIIRPGHMLQIS